MSLGFRDVATVLSLVFFAGVAWAQLSSRARWAQLRRDVNGIGSKLKEQGAAADRRYLNLALVAELNAPEDRKQTTVNLLKE